MAPAHFPVGQEPLACKRNARLFRLTISLGGLHRPCRFGFYLLRLRESSRAGRWAADAPTRERQAPRMCICSSQAAGAARCAIIAQVRPAGLGAHDHWFPATRRSIDDLSMRRTTPLAVGMG